MSLCSNLVDMTLRIIVLYDALNPLCGAIVYWCAMVCQLGISDPNLQGNLHPEGFLGEGGKLFIAIYAKTILLNQVLNLK